MIRPKEDEEQKAVVEWLRVKRIKHYANVSENQGSFLNKRITMQIQSKAKKMGAIRGVPDLTIFLPDKILYIEMKRKMKILKSGKFSNADSKPSLDQLAFMEWASKLPYVLVEVGYGAEDAIKKILKNLK